MTTNAKRAGMALAFVLAGIALTASAYDARANVYGCDEKSAATLHDYAVYRPQGDTRSEPRPGTSKLTVVRLGGGQALVHFRYELCGPGFDVVCLTEEARLPKSVTFQMREIREVGDVNSVISFADVQCTTLRVCGFCDRY